MGTPTTQLSQALYLSTVALGDIALDIPSSIPILKSKQEWGMRHEVCGTSTTAHVWNVPCILCIFEKYTLPLKLVAYVIRSHLCTQARALKHT